MSVDLPLNFSSQQSGRQAHLLPQASQEHCFAPNRTSYQAYWLISMAAAVCACCADINNMAANMGTADHVPLTQRLGSFRDVVLEEEVSATAAPKNPTTAQRPFEGFG